MADELSYEWVSPQFKGGYGVEGIDAVSSGGDRLAYSSRGAFGGIPAGPGPADYIATRGATGWSTAPLLPPAILSSAESSFDFSQTLDTSLFLGTPSANYARARSENTENEFLLHDTATPDTEAYWEIVGRFALLQNLEERRLQAIYVGASADFCHILLEEGRPLLPVPGIFNEVYEIYELARGCDGSKPSLTLVGVDNHDGGSVIDGLCGVELGAGTAGSYGGDGKGSVFDAVADGGSEVFFTAGVEEVVRAKEECPDRQLFVRLDGTRTLEVSRTPEVGRPFGGCESNGVPGEVPCAGALGRPAAKFAGADESGDVVYFTSGTPADLYVARIGCPEEHPVCVVDNREILSVTRISIDHTTGSTGGVQGVLRVAPNGERVYYVAAGVIGDETDSEGRLPIEGADNLYVYDLRSGATRFVGDLCSGPERSGSAQDAQCPADLNDDEGSDALNDRSVWRSTFESEAQTGGAGARFLVFSSYGRLTPDDTGGARNVYRYDAVLGELERVSVGEDYADDNGNDGGQAAMITFGSPGGPVFEQYEMGRRAISEDGSRIVFRTARALSPRASNGLANVYEWHREPGWNEARVSLVSCGCSPADDTQVVISPSGQDMFFTTMAGLATQDTDGAMDIYDAHECGADTPCYASPAAEVQRCEGEGCYGPLTSPAPLLLPESASQASDGNAQLSLSTKRMAKTTANSKRRKAKPRKARRFRGAKHGITHASRPIRRASRLRSGGNAADIDERCDQCDGAARTSGRSGEAFALNQSGVLGCRADCTLHLVPQEDQSAYLASIVVGNVPRHLVGIVGQCLALGHKLVQALNR